MLLTVITFFIILSVLILVHEFGHFLVAKKAKIKVEEFGFGLPPRIWAVSRQGTVYSVNLLPIGGFVKLAGEDTEEHGKTQKGMFWAKSKKERTAVVISGVVMNFLLAVVAFSVIYSFVGIPTKSNKVKILGIAPGSPAEIGGIKENDIVVLAGEKEIKDTQTFIEVTKEYLSKEMTIEIARDGENMVVFVVPRQNPPEGEGPLGIAISNVEMKFYPFYQMPFRGTVEGLKEAFAWTGMIVGALGGMFWQLLTLGALPKEVAGPVGIFQITGVVAKTGILSILQFLGILSINLAVVNILPLPALDGGRLLFLGIEAVTGKRVKAKVERWVHSVGMVILLFLILLVTINDIARILESSGFASHLKSLLP